MRKLFILFVGLLLTTASFGAIEVANIAAFKATSSVTNYTEYKITGNVTFVWKSGRNIYVKDATGGLLVYDDNNTPVITKNYQNGDVISGGIVGTLTVYNGLCEMIPTQDWTAGASGTPVAPTTVTMSQLLANFTNYESQLIKLEGVKFDADDSFGTNLNITQNGNAMVCRNHYNNITGYAVNSTDSYNIVGFAVPYNANKQIAPRNEDDIQLAPTVNDSLNNGTSGAVDIKISTFNVEWLGCPSNGPNNESLQMQNVAEVIKMLDADIVALQEITMSPTNSLEDLLEQLGSEWAGEVKQHAYNNNCFQDMGIIYKKSSISLTSSQFIGSNWARNPALYSVKVTKGGKAIPLEIVNIHAKATTSTSNPESDYSTRVANSKNLKNVLDNSTYNTKNIVLLGDYNDYLQGTQCGSCGNDSPYKNFMDDVANYKGLTGHLQNSRYNNPTIDNITISNELFNAYVSNSAKMETEVTADIPNYRNTTSDHTPVSITLTFGTATAAPKNTYSAQLLLYPNPVQHTLSVESMAGNMASIKVFSLNGTLIFEQKNIGAPQLSISTAAWQSGMYLVTVYSEKGEVASRLVIRN